MENQESSLEQACITVTEASLFSSWSLYDYTSLLLLKWPIRRSQSILSSWEHRLHFSILTKRKRQCLNFSLMVCKYPYFKGLKFSPGNNRYVDKNWFSHFVPLSFTVFILQKAQWEWARIADPECLLWKYFNSWGIKNIEIYSIFSLLITTFWRTKWKP